jgi:MSHA type pilus biogenesis protein MshL
MTHVLNPLEIRNTFPASGLRLARRAGTLVSLCMLAACAYPPAIPESPGHIKAEARETNSGDIPQPVRLSAFVPPPQASAKPQTYSVVVNEVPVKELLFALGRDSKLNVDIHPAIHGLVTMNAVDEPITAILDRLAQQVDLRYKLDGATLIVTPDAPYLETYRVDYVNLSRQTESAIGVTTQIASVGSSTATGGQVGGGGGAVGNSSTTSVKSKSDNSFWEILGENIRNIISSTRTINRIAEDKSALRELSAAERAERLETARAEREERRKDAEAAARAGAGAPGLLKESGLASSQPAAQLVQNVKEEVIVNPVAGTVSVLATERQQKLVKQYLDGVMVSAQRQVLIEATIVEVALSDQYQAGVDWSRIADTGAAAQSMLGANLKAAPNFTFTYQTVSPRIGNLSLTVKALETFGNTKVLSSPKIMALNNQTAVLKVVENLVYFSISVTPATYGTGNTILTPATYTSDPHTVPVGLVMSVTPQVNKSGMVSLTVRPTISRLVRYVDDPNPALKTADVKNPVPEIQVREMESVLQVKTGETVILGGLMRDDTSKSRDGLPVLSRLPGILGDAFSYRNDTSSKTELVIFLRPTVIEQPSLDSAELRAFQQYLPKPPLSPLAKP